MDIEYAKYFLKDIQKITDHKLKESIKACITQLKKIHSLSEIVNLKKMVGYESYYRIRLGDYRIGFSVNGKTIRLLRILHRKDIYTFFP